MAQNLQSRAAGCGNGGMVDDVCCAGRLFVLDGLDFRRLRQ